MDRKPRLIVVDGSAVAYRSYFAFIRQPLRNSRGENTSAAFGFAKALMSLLSDYEPDYVCVVFDTAAPTHRHEAYEAYKATRPEMPEELQIQLPWIKSIAEAMGVTVIEKEGFEADDLMATLAERATASGIETLLMTSDKDMYQLVDDGVKICDPKTGDLLGRSEVEKKFGVPPEKVVDVLGLAGDRSDNIPGVDGIGPKTAVSLIAKYGSIEGVYENLDSISGAKRKESLIENREIAELSRRLATLDRNVDMGIGLDELMLNDGNFDELSGIFGELDFTSLLKDFSGDEGTLNCSHETVSSDSELSTVAGKLAEAGRVAVYAASDGTCDVTARLEGLGLCMGDECFYVPVGLDSERELKPESTIALLGELIAGNDLEVCGHDLKSLLLCLENEGLTVAKLGIDTQVASYLIDPTRAAYKLEDLAAEHLGFRRSGTLKEQDGIAPEDAGTRCCDRAAIVQRLSEILPEKLEELELSELFEKIEMPLIRVLAGMERTGVAVDVSVLDDLSVDLEKRLVGIEEEIYQLAGDRFNIGSPKQLGEVLFNKLGLKPGRKTATGYSTAEDVLRKLSQTHALPDLVLSYRQLAKLKSTYVDSLRTLINSETGRIHTSFNQTVTATGRLSSTNPNLQNIPMRTEEGRQIRKAFVAGPSDWVMLSADYSQIELRLLAHLSGDRGLKQAFSEGRDIHTSTAATLMGVEERDVTPDMRSRAKEVNFGIIYGMGSHGLASRLNIDHNEAKSFIDGYFGAFPEVLEFIETTIEDARSRGFVTTILNRRRYLPGMNSESKAAVRLSERMAVNTRIQGSAADLIKIAMIEVDRKIREMKLEAAMIIQVHDELVFEVSKNDLGRLEEMAVREMSSVAGLDLDVPIVVNTASGKTWFDAHA